jgi:hypothetical protein
VSWSPSSSRRFRCLVERRGSVGPRPPRQRREFRGLGSALPSQPALLDRLVVRVLRVLTHGSCASVGRISRKDQTLDSARSVSIVDAILRIIGSSEVPPLIAAMTSLD